MQLGASYGKEHAEFSHTVNTKFIKNESKLEAGQDVAPLYQPGVH